jgi:hypothetical protein
MLENLALENVVRIAGAQKPTSALFGGPARPKKYAGKCGT